MKVRIEIDTKTFVRFWLVVIGFAFAILAIYAAQTALIMLGAALFLALALNKPVSFLARYLPGKSRVWPTAGAFILVVAVLGLFLFLIVPPIVQQTIKFAQTVPTLVETATTQWHGLNELITRYNLQPQVDSAMESIRHNTSTWAANLGSNVLTGLGSFASLVGSTFLVLVLTFLMLVEGPMWMQRLWGIYNNQERMENHRELAHKMYNVVTGYVTGQLTVSSIGSLSAGFVVFILSFIFPNIPANLALPTIAIAFTLSLIPMFGATIGGVLVSLLLAFNDLTAGIVFAVYFIIYQQIENNFISPTIQARKLELSALAVLTSVTIGLYVFGLAGGIISIPIAGCIKVLLEDYLERAKKNRVKSEKPLTKLVKKLQGEDGGAAA
ncbi:MAG TPA: AI-2E family transporter [Candidatus Saccharimonadales bacterium]|nr:AI-2E family transporter [Candidatus Saccharimonadales bacterium]